MKSKKATLIKTESKMEVTKNGEGGQIGLILSKGTN